MICACVVFQEHGAAPPNPDLPVPEWPEASNSAELEQVLVTAGEFCVLQVQGAQQELLHTCSFPSKMNMKAHSRARMVDMSALVSLSAFTRVRISVFISEVHNSCLNHQKLPEEISSQIADLRACQNLQMAVHGDVNWWTWLSNCPWGGFLKVCSSNSGRSSSRDHQDLGVFSWCRVKGFIFPIELHSLSQNQNTLRSLIQSSQLTIIFLLDRKVKYTKSPLQLLGLCEPQGVARKQEGNSEGAKPNSKDELPPVSLLCSFPIPMGKYEFFLNL